MTADGLVALWHPDCWELRDEPLPSIDPAPPAPPPARPGRGFEAWARIVAGASATAVTLAAVTLAARGALAASVWPLDQDDTPAALAVREPLAVRSAMPAREDPPPRAERLTFKPIEPADEVPLVDGVPLDELYPSLKGWIHPVTASAEYMPTFPPRLFGAHREGIERAECGAGHCGVDLDGPRGRPLVAVAPGILANVERREMGADGRSGRYVRIRHEDNTFTAYMHMDEVAEDLQVGGAVARGQYLGTLGATAVYSAPPHLHFSLQVPASKDLHGDYIPTRYVNPAPFLMRATIVPVIERPSRPALN